MSTISNLVIFFIGITLLLGCSKSEPGPCHNVTCLNGGVCSDGYCDCPDRFYGSECSYQWTPDYIHVTQVDINRFPMLKENGQEWDSGDSDTTSNAWGHGPNPDIRLIFRATHKNSNKQESGFGIGEPEGSYIKLDTQAPLTRRYTYRYVSNGEYMDPPVDLYVQPPDYTIRITIKDFDYDEHDIIGSVEGVLYSADNGFPETITLQNNEIELILHLKYVYT